MENITININVYCSQDEKDFAEKIVAELERLLRSAQGRALIQKITKGY